MRQDILQSANGNRTSRMTGQEQNEILEANEEEVYTAESFWHRPKEEDSNDEELYDEHIVEVDDDLPIVRPQEPPDEISTTEPFRKWTFILGLGLAFISGMVFTANNCVIQTFDLDFAETLLVRSFIQILVVAPMLAVKGYHPWPSIGEHPNRTRALIVFQGFLGGLMIICAFCSVLYLPLGDALTMIFSAPLSTMVIAAIFLKHSLRLYKITFGLLLLVGTIMVVRPPFIFDNGDDPDSQDQDGDDEIDFMVNNNNITLPNQTFDNPILVQFYSEVYLGEDTQIFIVRDKNNSIYFIGVAIALSSALLQGFLNVSVNFCQKVPSLVLLFWAGIGGLVVSLLAFTFDERARILGPSIVDVPYTDWICFIFMAFSGMVAYFSLTKALQMIDPTIAAFMRSLEIIFAYIMQAAITQQMPPLYSILGASLVMFSVSAIALQKHFMAVIPDRLKVIF